MYKVKACLKKIFSKGKDYSVPVDTKSRPVYSGTGTNKK